MRSIRVVSTTKDANGMIRIVKEIEDDAGNLELNLHIIHEETIEWRAAELGYDPVADINKIVDLIVYEPCFPPDYQNLYDFDDDEEARQSLENQVQLAKARLVPTNRPDRATVTNLVGRIDESYLSSAEPIRAIKDLSIVGAEEYEMKRVYVSRLKEQAREVRRKIREDPPIVQPSRAERLKLQLGGNRGIDNGPEG